MRHDVHPDHADDELPPEVRAELTHLRETLPEGKAREAYERLNGEEPSEEEFDEWAWELVRTMYEMEETE